MAYGLKYQSEFYNIFQTLVQVQFTKEDYVGAVTNLRTQSVEIAFNFQGHDTPISGTGARIVIANEDGYPTLNDLLTAREREYICTIIYGGVTVFKGYSICDLNEQEFLPKSFITLQFTDYLRKLEDYKLDCLADIADNTSIFTMLAEMITTLGFDLHTQLYLNSTLFEERMSNGVNDSFLEQTFVENNAFFTDNKNYDNAYDAINKVLKPMGAYLYSAGDKWVLERQEDINRSGNWVMFTVIGGEEATGLNQTLYKQGTDSDTGGDFYYVDTTQKIAYDTGIQKLTLKLNDKLLDTFVFNNYDPGSDDSSAVNDGNILYTVNTYPSPGELLPRTWYIYYQATDMEKGYGFHGMNTYLKRTMPGGGSYENKGFYYAFDVQFGISEDEPTTLSIGYTMSVDQMLDVDVSVSLRFSLMVDGGAYDGQYVVPLTTYDGTVIPILSETANHWEQIISLNTSTTSRERTWSLNMDLNFTDSFMDDNIGENAFWPSLWRTLGSPTTQRFVIMFWPAKINLSEEGSFRVPYTQYIGDISIQITQRDIPNEINYTVSEGFIKTEDIDIDFWDLNNINYSNGFMIDIGSGGEEEMAKTAKWVSEDSPTAIPLLDIYAKNKYRNYSKTVHKLISTIQYNGYLKPFTVITDENLNNDSGENMTLLLQAYKWDLNNGIYNIEAEEYTDNNIILAGDVVDMTEAASTPGGLSASQETSSFIDGQWTAVTGATGYRLQRYPVYNNGTWMLTWREIYSGVLTSFSDVITDEGTPTEGMEIKYRVCAYNDNGNSAYSAEVAINWVII